jgi:hypothetical protein
LIGKSRPKSDDRIKSYFRRALGFAVLVVAQTPPGMR